MGRELGSQYVLEKVIGRGATGEVWRGWDRNQTPLAFKVLHESLGRDPEVVRRFVQERAILTGLSHQNLVRVRDLVVEGDKLAIVMDYISGSDLRGRLAGRGALPPAEACRIGAEVAAGLAAAHAAGVVHRDIKPENILLDDEASPPVSKLTDFGVAKIAQQSSTGRSTMLTGTPQYTAPELFDGQPPTPAADLYALGILLYEMCCGVTPFVGDSALAVLRRHAEQEAGRPEGIPDPLWELIAQLLAKAPQERLATAGPATRVSNVLTALAQDLSGVRAAPTLSAPPAATPLVHSRPTELGTGAHRPAGARPRRSRTVVLAVALGTVIAIALGAGAAAALGAFGTSGDNPGTGSGAAPGAAGATPGPAPGESPAASPSPSPSPSPGLMPSLTGMSESQARRAIPAGVAVEVLAEPPPLGTPDGVVLDQQPAAGEPIGDRVVLTVSATSVILALVDLAPIFDGNFDVERVELEGEISIGSSLIRRLSMGSGYSPDPVVVEYNLGRRFTALTGTAGHDDRSEWVDAEVLLEIFGDGRELYETSLMVGAPVSLDVDVTNVLRLQFRWTPLSTDRRYSSVDLVLFEPALVPEPGYDPHDEP